MTNFTNTMNRNHQLDFFRGLFLILILVDHYLTYENVVRKFTSEFIGWVSAAEAFVFLSGLTAGLVYTYRLREKGEAFIAAASRKRAWDIYRYHIALLLLTVGVIFSHGAMQHFWEGRYGAIVQDPVTATLLGSLLLYQPIYLDILPMYAVFLLFVPLAVRSFEKGNQLPVLSVSFLGYLVGTFDLAPPALGGGFLPQGIDLGFFSLLSWQFLFAVGLLLGFRTFHGKVGGLQRHKGLLLAALAVSGALFLLKHSHASFGGVTCSTGWTKGTCGRSGS